MTGHRQIVSVTVRGEEMLHVPVDDLAKRPHSFLGMPYATPDEEEITPKDFVLSVRSVTERDAEWLAYFPEESASLTKMEATRLRDLSTIALDAFDPSQPDWPSFSKQIIGLEALKRMVDIAERSLA